MSDLIAVLTTIARAPQRAAGRPSAGGVEGLMELDLGVVFARDDDRILDLDHVLASQLHQLVANALRRD